jgi:RNA polymerase sigma factor (sigma-70 family)
MTDEELMLAVSKGDQSAYQTLVSQHLNAISHYAFRLLGNRKDTEDICQEVFLKLWTKASKWQPEKAKLTTWLHRITHNLCIDYLRKHGGTQTSDTLDMDTAEQLLETPQSVEQNESITIDEKQRLNHAISLFTGNPAQCTHALPLRWFFQQRGGCYHECLRQGIGIKYRKGASQPPHTTRKQGFDHHSNETCVRRDKQRGENRDYRLNDHEY